MTDSLWHLGLGPLTFMALVGFVACYEAWRTIRRWPYVEPARSWKRGEPSPDARTTDGNSADHVFLVHAERFLDSQFTTNDTFDTKASASLGVGSTVLPLNFGLLAVADRTPPMATNWCLALAVFAYGALLVLVIRAVHIRGFEYRPTLQSLAESSQKYDAAVMRRWIADEYSTSAELNRPVLERKGRYVGWAYIALLVEGALISIGALASLFWSA